MPKTGQLHDFRLAVGFIWSTRGVVANFAKAWARGEFSGYSHRAFPGKSTVHYAPAIFLGAKFAVEQPTHFAESADSTSVSISENCTCCSAVRIISCLSAIETPLSENYTPVISRQRLWKFGGYCSVPVCNYIAHIQLRVMGTHIAFVWEQLFPHKLTCGIPGRDRPA